ncbi:phosphatidylinositol-3-phosphatase SAC1 [Lepeophtheirus salmonis]|nr:phosphatidylinositol-3-phosphatase SAC1-like [Lepeophtheirus salmonis]
MSLALYIAPDKFFIRDESSLSPSTPALVIDRLNCDIECVIDADIPVISNRKSIHGLLGIVPLLSGPHLVVITHKSKVGEIVHNHTIWKVEATEIISFSRANLHLTKEESEKNKVMMDMIIQVLSTPAFYFCHTLDMTRNIQNRGNTDTKQSLIQSADFEYVWNRKLLEPFFDRPELHRFCLPIIHGAIFIQRCSVNGKFFRWALISRRSSDRVGTRFFVRGVNHFGKVANFVETEQIVEHDGAISSFVQSRGSIPMFWSQLPTLEYMPKPSIMLGEDHQTGFDVHFGEQINKYGDVVAVNLINTHGYEGKLEKSYRQLCSNSVKAPRISYEGFDFHAEGWSRISKLIDRLSSYQNKFNFFYYDSRQRTPNLVQSGIFRTNCMDCLDRTNVVQSMLAFENLKSVFSRMGISNSGLELNTDFIKVFKNVWADHADVIAVQYAGTRAMKTDFTRTGKRTYAGILDDGYNALSRYVKNNFFDGFRQDSLDIFIGKIGTGLNARSFDSYPIFFHQSEFKAVHIIPLSLLVIIASFFLILLFSSEINSHTFLFLFFLACLIAILLMMLFRFGPQFVDWPKFNQFHLQ